MIGPTQRSLKVIQFEVLGIPQTAGSKRAFALKKNGAYTGRVAVADNNPKGKDWKNRVADAGNEAMSNLWKCSRCGAFIDWKTITICRPDPSCPECDGDHTCQRINELFAGPLEVHFIFRMPRLKSHYRTNGELKQNAPSAPIVRPDALKLARCAEDALTGVCWHDDSQIVVERLVKLYSDKPGMTVTITPLDEPTAQPNDTMRLKGIA